MQTGIKIVSIWSAGLLIGLVFRTLLPPFPTIGITLKDVLRVLPLNRLVFWACVIIGLVWGIILMLRAMTQDLIPPID